MRERVDATAAQLPTHAWRRYQCGPGSKGPRCFEWTRIAISEPSPGCHSLLIRRASDGELAFYTIPRRHETARYRPGCVPGAV